jgi:rod shape-determining protein MreC
MKPLFGQDSSPILRIMSFILISIVTMVLDHHRYDPLKTLRTHLNTVLYPIQYLVNLPSSGKHWIADTLSSKQQLATENATLRTKNQLLLVRQQAYMSLERENMRLRDLLKSSYKLTRSKQLLIAEVLNIGLDSADNQMIINKGHAQNVYIGQVAMDANGIMGQVSDLGLYSSTITLITDAAHAIPLEVNRNGLRAIAIGTGDNHQMNLRHLPNDADIEVGDLLVTSGFGGRFPSGHPVATVTQIKRNRSRPFAQIHITPTAHITRSREILLIWQKAQPTDLEIAP